LQGSAHRQVQGATESENGIAHFLDREPAAVESRPQPVARVEIERLARERLGYVREGETAFVVVSPRDPDPAPSAEDPVEMAEMIEEEPWYSRWWSYLSGSDLSADS